MAWERMSNIGRYLRILCLKSTSQKNRRKNRIVRIFCELFAKMRLGSLINRGFPEGTVEMREARRRALTQFPSFTLNIDPLVEMREARTRALTHFEDCFVFIIDYVEMREARRRALTPVNIPIQSNTFKSRNERSPKKGIDTVTVQSPTSD